MDQEKLIISNWKDYIQTEIQAREILGGVNDYLESLAETKELALVFCPKGKLLLGVAELLKKSHLEHCAFLGSQDLLDQVAEGLRYVILGHSSRRYGLGETDAIVSEKIKKTLEKELIPIVCIGEKDKDDKAEEFMQDQASATFNELSADQISRCVIVYEPVWAITSATESESDNPNNASNKIGFIRKYFIESYKLKIENLPKILYGGSVNSENIGAFLSEDIIAGVLIGKASTVKPEFLKILMEVTKLRK